MSAAPIVMPAIGSVWHGAAQGKFAGIAAGRNGDCDYPLILLDAKPPKLKMPWDDCVAWAKSVGGRLPTRAEGHLLMANLPGEFEKEWYWLGEQFSSDDAWCQNFSYGYQSYFCKTDEVLWRPVRSSVLQSFDPSKGAEPIKPDTTNALLRQILDQTTGLRTDLQTIFLGDTGAKS